MEILSDATFKGKVNINGDFFVAHKGWEGFPLIGTVTYPPIDNVYGLKFHASEFTIFGEGFSVNDDNSNTLIATNVRKESDLYTFMVNGTEFVSDTLIVKGGIRTSNINLLGTGSYLSLGCQALYTWSGLNNILDFAKLSTFTSPSIPANCTAFEFTGTAISDTNKTHMIQVQNTSTGKSVIAETWITTNKKPAMSFAGCTSTIAAGTYTAMVV